MDNKKPGLKLVKKKSGKAKTVEPDNVAEVLAPPSSMTIVIPGEAIAAAQSVAEVAVGPIRDQKLIEIRNQTDYDLASLELSQTATAMAKVRLAFYGTDDSPGIIPSIRGGLEKIYALYNALNDPLEARSKTQKERMKKWQLEERERIRKEHAAKEAEMARLAREAEELRQKAAEASTPKERAKAETEADYAEMKSHVAALRPIEGPPRAAGSSSSMRTKWRLTSMPLLVLAIADGEAPMEFLALDEVAMNKAFNAPGGKEAFEKLDGVEVYEDVQIAGRKG